MARSLYLSLLTIVLWQSSPSVYAGQCGRIRGEEIYATCSIIEQDSKEIASFRLTKSNAAFKKVIFKGVEARFELKARYDEQKNIVNLNSTFRSTQASVDLHLKSSRILTVNEPEGSAIVTGHDESGRVHNLGFRCRLNCIETAY